MPLEDHLKPYWFDLPQERIALRPAQPRSAAKLLVIHNDGRLDDHTIADLPSLLQQNDLLVTNTTKVIPAALKAIRKARTEDGKDVEVSLNLVARETIDIWACLAKPARRLKIQDRLWFTSSLWADVISEVAQGKLSLRFNISGPALDAEIDRIGHMPIPPYIAKQRATDANDRHDYQTIFAKGDAQSVAAPTASLHFTAAILDRLSDQGVKRTDVRLHVGMGTFAPLTEDNLQTNRLHAEWRSLSEQAAKDIRQTQDLGRRVIAVGSTAMRTLESCVIDGKLMPQTGPTDIFIQPGYRFKVCGGMLTNFHLPASSLFMLVCAFMGRDVMQKAYSHAINQQYRFYSYGDACLLLP